MRALILTFFFFSSALYAAPHLDDVQAQLMGNYHYLIESQVKCDGSFKNGTYICNKDLPGERRIKGTWDSVIIPLIGPMEKNMRWVDSNVFVTAHTVFPLFSLKFKDAELEKERLNSIHQAMSAVNLFRRNNGFAFWPRIGVYSEGDTQRVGALNLSLPVLAGQLGILDKMQNLFHTGLLPKNKQWMIENVDLNNRDFGVLFNIPNDADDTSLGIISNYYYYQDKPNKAPLDRFVTMTEQFASYTDTYEQRKNRRYKKTAEGCTEWAKSGDDDLFTNEEFLRTCSLDDPREAWKYDSYEEKHSGAVMTWLYDENKGFYDNPEEGLAFTGQNSVDCNVLANVSNALSLTGKRDDPNLRDAYENTCMAIANTIIDENGNLKKAISPRKIDQGITATWKTCGLFYPAHMTFPYLLTKAINEAGACQDLDSRSQERFDRAIEVLTTDIMAEQKSKDKNKESGIWYEKIDKTKELPTALGATALINIFHSYGDRLDIRKSDLKSAINRAVDYLLNHSKKSVINGKKAISLPEGTFFGGGTVDEIAHWRSAPFATAVSLELMSKYLKTFGNSKVENDKLVIGSGEGDSSVDELYRAKSLPDNYQEDTLPTYSKTSVDTEVTAGLKLGKSNEAIIGIQLTAGEIYQGTGMDSNEKIAFYKVKLSSEFGIDPLKGDFESLMLDAKFMGVSTNTDRFISSEFAYLPITIVKQGDLKQMSAHLFSAWGDLPVLNLGNGSRLNVNATARVLGYITQTLDGKNISDKLRSYDLVDIKVGVSYHVNRFSVRASYGAGIGYSEDQDGNGMSSHNNSSTSIEASYQINGNQSVSIGWDHGGYFNDDQFYVKYEYKF